MQVEPHGIHPTNLLGWLPSPVQSVDGIFMVALAPQVEEDVMLDSMRESGHFSEDQMETAEEKMDDLLPLARVRATMMIDPDLLMQLCMS